MVRPTGEPAPSSPFSFDRRAIAFAATSMAGLSRKLSVSSSNFSRERASLSSASSPVHACRRNASRFSGERSRTAWSSLSSCLHRSGSIAPSAAEFAVKPQLGDAPVASHRGRRYFENFGRLLYAESAKEAHLDDLHFARIETGQCVQGIIERDKITLFVRRPIAAHNSDLFQRDMRHTRPTFYVMAPGMVNQYAPHHLGRHREEMCAI